MFRGNANRSHLLVVVGASALLLLMPLRSAGDGPAVDLHGDPLPPGALARIGTLRFRQPGASSIAIAPDGRLIAVGSSSSYVRSTVALFDADTGKVVRRLPGHGAAVFTVAFSPDGKRLASSGSDHTLRVWDLARGERVCEADATVTGDALAFLAGGKMLATSDDNGAIRVLDATTGKTVRFLRGHEQHVFCLAAAPDGTRLVSCSRDGTTRIWDGSSGKAIHRWQISVNGSRGVAFSHDAKLLACGAYFPDGIELWDLRTGNLRWRVRRKEGLAAWGFSVNDAEVYAFGEQLRVLDTATGKERRRLPTSEGGYCATLTADGKTFAVLNGGELRRYDLATGEWLGGREGHRDSVSSLAFSPDGSTLATASDEAVFRLWDATDGRLRKTFAGSANALAFAPDGRTLATAGTRAPVGLWDVATGTRTRILKTAYIGETFGRIAFTAGQPQLVAHERDWRLLFWDAATGKEHRHSYARQNEVGGIPGSIHVRFALAPDGKTVAVAGERDRDVPILLWDLTTGKERLPTTVHGVPYAFSPDGRLLAAQGAKGVVFVNIRTGREVRRLVGPAGFFDAVFSPDGKMLATAGTDGTVRLWEMASAQERRCFKGHAGCVFCVAFAPDGRRLASGSADLTVLIWDVSSK